jgi:hypothetical protein
LPRRRPPVEIFTAPVPDSMAKSVARCPICSGRGEPYGWVVERLVYRCTGCGVRFKDGAPGNVGWGAGRER